MGKRLEARLRHGAALRTARQAHRDDHDVAALLERPDGRLLAVRKHGNDPLQRWRISETAGSIDAWAEERTLDVGAGYTYSNLYQLTSEVTRSIS